ncbi:hypothetical protein Acor_27150 [Acrocarpospora corrugata]|uniref:DhaK domain-containing protein n=1 Tax=Acrocarpospora corrugata TaxID=35763 RepID=A0A5M3W0K9_9ACTN|nr:dihydroxyacetone kinase subunit DhaK [Acrocarpospora corrugata]GES00651.1 hypothetical protein Acor_27150 [Acrocarpospora corrugata]
MTYVFNSEAGFKDEFLAGLTAAYGRYLRKVPSASGVMSVSAPVRGRASVLIGGGSGHYPAFAGLVGPGLCDGAVVGDVFTSPSAEHVYRCVKALDGGAGVLLSFGNYSGDVMHFGTAVERARREGVDARIVLVTDDVASAPGDRRQSRRGLPDPVLARRHHRALPEHPRHRTRLPNRTEHTNRPHWARGPRRARPRHGADHIRLRG